MSETQREIARKIAYKHLNSGDPLGWFEDLYSQADKESSFIAPNGTLLAIARGREPSDPEGNMPWPLTKEEMSLFEAHGLKEFSFENFMDNEEPPVRRFRATYYRKP